MIREREEWEVYKVELTKLPNDLGGYEERWFITKDALPVYEVNSYLDELSINNPKTAKTYVYSLVKYFNYLELIGKSYDKATSLTVKHFLTWQIYGYDKSLKVRSQGNQLSYSTLKGDISAIRGFYKFLYSEVDDISMGYTIEKTRVRKESFFYGQISQTNFLKIVDKHIRNLKGSKEYIKWYTKDQIQAILDNLNTLRDKAIFLLQLEGMRIDEVLSIKLSSYDQFDKSIQPTRSKGKETINDGEENTLRTIYLDDITANCLDKYIITERTEAENSSEKYNEWMFINLRDGESQGEVLSQANYRKILKTASFRAGLDPNKIRTHSGRSTKAMQLIEQQVLHPEDGISDLIIRELMGWKRIDSIDPYKQNNNKTIAKEASKKTQRRKNESRDN